MHRSPTLFNSLPGMAYRSSHNPQREMTLVSKGALDLTGHAPIAFIEPATIPYGSLIHAQDRQQVMSELAQAIGAERPFEILYRLRTASGEIKWVLERGGGVFDENGRLEAVEGFIADITERVLAEQLLEQRVHDRTRKLTALYDVLAVAAGKPDLKTVLAHALEQVLNAVHGQAGIVQLLGQEGNYLYLAAEKGLPKARLPQLAQCSAYAGLSGQIVQNKQPIANLYATLANNDPFKQAALQAFASLPMNAPDHLVGVLTVFRQQQRPFSEGDLDLLASVADQIGATIESARLRRDNERLVVLEERNRLARELHDSVTQSLYSLTIFAEVNKRFAQAQDYEEVARYADRIAETAENTLKEMRLLLHNLRPSSLQEAGFVGALQQRLDSVEKRAGISTRLIVADGITLSPPVEEALFHIAEEALNNALKHACATAVVVQVSQNAQQLCLTIRDNGRGFNPNQLADQGGLGLASMRERAALLQGELMIESVEKEGTAVSVTLSLHALAATTDSKNLLDLP